MSDSPPAPNDADFNPFQAPETVAVASDAMNNDEQIRTEHIAHESSIKSVGFLYLLGAVINAVLLVTAVSAMNRGARVDTVRLIAFLLQLAWLLPTSIGLIRLAPWSRWMGLIFVIVNSVVMLGSVQPVAAPVIPIILIINGYIFSLFVRAKARMVFSPEYRDIIQRTPHVRRKTSRLLVGCLGVLLLFILVAVIGALVGG